MKKTHTIRKNKSSYFTPNKGRDKWLDIYIDCVRDDIVHGLQKLIPLMNITKEEEKAFQDLLNDDSIVIRPADKRSGITVLNRKDYI